MKFYLGFFCKSALMRLWASGDNFPQVVELTLKSPWTVFRIISSCVAPSNGNFPQSTKKRITPTDQRSASWPYPYQDEVHTRSSLYTVIVRTSGATYESVPHAVSILSFGRSI